MSTPDQIEREVTIDAPVERVWALVTEPGWWVGDGNRSGQRRWREGDLDVVEDPRYGRYPIRVEAVEPPRYVSYRWAFAVPGEDPQEGNSTRVEFWLSERDGGTLLRVVESGFAALTAAAEVRNRSVDPYGNLKGWVQQLDILKSRAERVSA